jgi:cyclopropane-fatty-acyl-phospholipid synthase
MEKILFKILNNKELKGELNIKYNNKVFSYGNRAINSELIYTQKADLNILNSNFFWRVALFGDTGFGESYFLGEIETADLKSLLLWFLQNQKYFPGFRNKNNSLITTKIFNIFLNIIHLMRKNTRRGSKKNIRSHYDLSNDFYKLWLDPTMTYSAAIFKDTNDLEQAQINKYKNICDKLGITKNDHVLEIGCGWGGFATYAAKNYGCSLTITTISDEQFTYCSNHIKQHGLSEKISLIKTDYRDLDGKYDKIVSIEMMEALGHEYVPIFIKKCEQLLKAGGSARVQCITYPDEFFEKYLKQPNYIQQYIFPGGELLSLEQIFRNARESGLQLTDKESIGKDYAITLHKWRNSFESKKSEILKLGFDEQFFRKWIYYFVFCEVGFETGYIDDFQLQFIK